MTSLESGRLGMLWSTFLTLIKGKYLHFTRTADVDDSAVAQPGLFVEDQSDLNFRSLELHDEHFALVEHRIRLPLMQKQGSHSDFVHRLRRVVVESQRHVLYYVR